MNKDSIAQLENTIEDIIMLKNDPDSVLLEPISTGKWSIREIVGHLLYWDIFNLETMVPFMSNGAVLPPFPDHDAHNKEAVCYIETFDSVASLIDAFAESRKQFIESIAKIDDSIRFTIENEPDEFSTESFVRIFIEHDSHHLQQIQLQLDKGE